MIQAAKGKEEKLRNMDPTKTFSTNELERAETNMCLICEKKDTCGIYTTTRIMVKNMEAQEENKDTVEENPVEAEKERTESKQETREKFDGGDKRQVWNIL